MAAGIQMLGGLGLLGLAVLFFVIGAIVQRAIAKAAAAQAPRPELPVATVVAGGSERSQDAPTRAVR